MDYKISHVQTYIGNIGRHAPKIRTMGGIVTHFLHELHRTSPISTAKGKGRLPIRFECPLGAKFEECSILVLTDRILKTIVLKIGLGLPVRLVQLKTVTHSIRFL